MNQDPWAEWKAGKTTSESNSWTDYQKKNPVKVSDVSSGVDPYGAMAAGALATLLGKGIGAAIGAAFADGGLVQGIYQAKPKTEKHAKSIRQTRQKHQEFKKRLKLADGGVVNPDVADEESNDILARCALARQVSKLIDPSQAQDPEAIQAAAEYLLTYSDEEERQGWISEFLDSFDPNGSVMFVLDQSYTSPECSQAPTGDVEMADEDKVGVKLAGGGFLGGNLGIALGAGADEWDKQRLLSMQEGRYATEQKLAKPELDTIDEATAARRSNLKARDAENQANASMIDDRTTNARLKLANDNADMESQAYGRLGQFKGDTQGGIGYLNKTNLPQLGGGTATGLAFDGNGANVNLSDGRTVQIPQATLDRGTKALNGNYGFTTNRVTGDIVRFNERTGEAEPVIRADGTVNRPLTVPQQTNNQQIEISRQKISGLSPEEIRRRTLKESDTGRPNPDFDPLLAQHVRLANKRKYGQDDWFDSQGQSNQAPAQTAAQDVGAKFAADPNMSGYKMGRRTARGVEVLDASGKQIGWYN